MGQIITNLSKQPVVDRLAEANRQGLKPWLRIGDASAVPDRGFRKQLKCLDPTLEMVWNCISCNWEIWSFPKTGIDPYLVMRVGKPGTFEEMSQKVLLQMQENIFYKDNFSAKQLCDFLEEHERQMQRRRERDMMNRINSVTVDTRAYALGVLQVQVPRKTMIERAVANG